MTSLLNKYRFFTPATDRLGFLGFLGFLKVFYEPLWVLHLFFLFFIFYLLGFVPKYKQDYARAVSSDQRNKDSKEEIT